MKVYTKFIVISFLKSFLYVSAIFFSLVLILNTLTEVEFFKNIDVKPYFPIYISLLNSPDLLFEMFPFIFLVSTQAFFIKMFSDNQIQIFKYSGLRNSKILSIICFTSLIMGTLIILLFYSLSSNLKNIYLEEKNRYTIDDKYLAVVTKNGLWIKDEYENKSIIVHAKKINNNTFAIRTYERGVEAETLSCGTGATAVAIAMFHSGQSTSNVMNLKTLGGELVIRFEAQSSSYSNVWLCGPALQVFKGTLEW